MRDDLLLEVLHDTATAVRAALDGVEDWSEAGTLAGQHHSDLAADAAALEMLERAELGHLAPGWWNRANTPCSLAWCARDVDEDRTAAGLEPLAAWAFERAATVRSRSFASCSRDVEWRTGLVFSLPLTTRMVARIDNPITRTVAGAVMRQAAKYRPP